MLCFEVHLNGQRLCTAGIGDFGVLSAMITWVSHTPEKLARWAAEGLPEIDAMRVDLEVGGLNEDASEIREHVKWIKRSLAVGDEIKLQITEARESDSPQHRHRDDPALTLEHQKDYVRQMATELGWEIRESA